MANIVVITHIRNPTNAMSRGLDVKIPIKERIKANTKRIHVNVARKVVPPDNIHTIPGIKDAIAKKNPNVPIISFSWGEHSS